MKGRESPRKDGVEELAEQVGEVEQRGHSSRWVPFFGGEGQDEYSFNQYSIVRGLPWLGLDPGAAWDLQHLSRSALAQRSGRKKKTGSDAIT